jgi:hypothetical protein
MKNEVFRGVTLCISGYAGTITSENNSLLRDSVGIYRADFDYLASKMLHEPDDRMSRLESFNLRTVHCQMF